MLHLESFSSFQEDKLKPLTDKYAKSGYISVSTSKKLKELGIEPEQFKFLEKRIRNFSILAKNNNYLLDMLLLDLNDMLESKGYGCERWDYNESIGKPSNKAKVKVHLGRTPIYYTSKDFEVNIEENPTDTLFSIIKGVNDTKKEIIKKRNEWYDSLNIKSKNARERDWGALSKYKNSNPYNDLVIKPIFEVQLKMYWGDLNPDMDWEDFTLTGEEVESRKTQRRNVIKEMEVFLKEDTFRRYFHLIGIKNIDFKISTDNFVYYSQSMPTFKIELDL